MLFRESSARAPGDRVNASEVLRDRPFPAVLYHGRDPVGIEYVPILPDGAFIPSPCLGLTIVNYHKLYTVTIITHRFWHGQTVKDQERLTRLIHTLADIRFQGIMFCPSCNNVIENCQISIYPLCGGLIVN